MIPRRDIINRAHTKASVPLFNRGKEELFAAAKRTEPKAGSEEPKPAQPLSPGMKSAE